MTRECAKDSVNNILCCEITELTWENMYGFYTPNITLMVLVNSVKPHGILGEQSFCDRKRVDKSRTWNFKTEVLKHENCERNFCHQYTCDVTVKKTISFEYKGALGIFWWGKLLFFDINCLVLVRILLFCAYLIRQLPHLPYCNYALDGLNLTEVYCKKMILPVEIFCSFRKKFYLH